MASMGSHQSARPITDTWLTPRHIVEGLGEFDLDPCCPEIMPWVTAKKMLTKKEDGLKTAWTGRVWMNPPYSKEATKWLSKLADHGNGIALIFARTETKSFFRDVWERADGILFIKDRLYFHYPDGARAKANSGAPSCLVAYGVGNSEILKNCSITGYYVNLITQLFRGNRRVNNVSVSYPTN